MEYVQAGMSLFGLTVYKLSYHSLICLWCTYLKIQARFSARGIYFFYVLWMFHITRTKFILHLFLFKRVLKRFMHTISSKITKYLPHLLLLNNYSTGSNESTISINKTDLKIHSSNKLVTFYYNTARKFIHLNGLQVVFAREAFLEAKLKA